MSARLSACIIACNEQELLPRCLDSLAWADEIVVVVDAKSTDRSEAIALCLDYLGNQVEQG